MDDTGARYLNLGSGDPAPGWVNLDASPLFLLPRGLHRALAAAGVERSRPYRDAAYRHVRFTPGATLPLADGSARAVYCSHVLEHLWPETIERVVDECRRVLAPGGVLRIVVPDLLAAFERARDGNPAFVAVARELEVLPPLLERCRWRAALEGAWGFPTAHRTILMPDGFATRYADQWEVRTGLAHLESAIAPDRLAAVEKPGRCADAHILELTQPA